MLVHYSVAKMKHNALGTVMTGFCAVEEQCHGQCHVISHMKGQQGTTKDNCPWGAGGRAAAQVREGAQRQKEGCIKERYNGAMVKLSPYSAGDPVQS